jgi:hypothetical protein
VVGGTIFLLLATWHRFRLGRRASAAPEIDGGVRPVERPADSLDRSILRIVAVLSLGAGAIHLAAAPHHYSELGDLGAGFLVSGLFQVGWARAALRAPSARTVWIGIGGNVGIVAAWIVARSLGLPAGAEPWMPEAIGLPDGAATAFEILVVAGLTLRLLGIDRSTVARWAPIRSIAAVAVIPVLGLVLLTASLATVAIAAGADHGPGHASHQQTAGHAVRGH